MPAPDVTLPFEVLLLVGSYLDATTLTKCCLVSKHFSQGFKPCLWMNIPAKALVSGSFADQFPHYYQHIRRIEIILPKDHAHAQPYLQLRVRRLSSNSQATILKTVPEKTLLDCTNLESISLDSASYSPPRYDPSKPVLHYNPVAPIFENNMSTLKTATFKGIGTRAFEYSYFSLLEKMPNLTSLSLLEWTRYDCNVLHTTLLYCQHLRTLRVKVEHEAQMDDLEGLKNWRKRYLLHQGGGEEDSEDEDDEDFMMERVWIPKVQNLILDGSMVSTNLIKALCGLMPELKVLSMKGAIGFYEDEDTRNEHFMHATGYEINWDDGHGPEDEEDWEEHDEDEEEEEEDDDDEISATIGAIAQRVFAEAQADRTENEDEDEDEESEEEEDSDGHDDDDNDDNDDDDFSAFGPNTPHMPDFSAKLALSRLRKTCPELQEFDFSYDRGELSEEFYCHLMKLWGADREKGGGCQPSNTEVSGGQECRALSRYLVLDRSTVW